MAKTHYDPFTYDSEEYTERAWCGTIVYENYEYSNNSNHVTCKKCLKLIPKIDKYVEDINEHRNKQDGDFVDFMERNGGI